MSFITVYRSVCVFYFISKLQVYKSFHLIIIKDLLVTLVTLLCLDHSMSVFDLQKNGVYFSFIKFRKTNMAQHHSHRSADRRRNES